jgi:hypothetical protein
MGLPRYICRRRWQRRLVSLLRSGQGMLDIEPWGRRGGASGDDSDGASEGACRW